MAMSYDYTWLFVIPKAMMILFCIVAILVVASKPASMGRPKRLALTSLMLVLLLQFAFPLVSFVASRFMAADGMAFLHGIVNVAVTSLMIFCWYLVLKAAFCDRDHKPEYSRTHVGGTPLADQPSDNPYAAPRR